jgi:nitroreductase/NAD-dependent dihydropyrimidine dehydrogenase PreA subunit
MRRLNTTTIDPELCNGCGLCVRECPSDTLTLVEGKAVASGPYSLGCEHCVAVCPTGAISVGFVEPDALDFTTFKADDRWLPYGEFDTAQLVRLMRSRRSCRDFAKDPIPREVLQDLVKIGTTAPSGTNSQLWTFTVLPDRESVEKLAAPVSAFFVRLNRMAEKPAARLLAKIFMKDALGEYYRDYYESVQRGLREYRDTGRDRLFHGAPAVLIISCSPGASCPSDDAHLATQNILLAAHAMGLGTCLIGFVVEAMKQDKSIKTAARIPPEERVYSVIALGKPKTKYRKPAGRKKPVIRWVEG